MKILLLVSLFLVTLCGCNGGDGDPQPQQQNQPPVPPPVDTSYCFTATTPQQCRINGKCSQTLYTSDLLTSVVVPAGQSADTNFVIDVHGGNGVGVLPYVLTLTWTAQRYIEGSYTNSADSTPLIQLDNTIPYTFTDGYVSKPNSTIIVIDAWNNVTGVSPGCIGRFTGVLYNVNNPNDSLIITAGKFVGASI